MNLSSSEPELKAFQTVKQAGRYRCACAGGKKDVKTGTIVRSVCMSTMIRECHINVL
jgi:hypothetical protein